MASLSIRPAPANIINSISNNPSTSLASVLGIGTAVPTHINNQATFPDYYFELTKSQHLVDLKAKFARICERSGIRKRYSYLSDDFLRANPVMTQYMAPSMNLRQEITDKAVPELGIQAAAGALKEWGHPASGITHLIFCTTSSGTMPGADFDVIKALDLPLTTKRYMLYHQGCHGGGTVLRLAKDLAENNPGARILVVCSEVNNTTFRGPSESHTGNLVGQAIFGDAAAALIVGSNPNADNEETSFQIVKSYEDIVPGSADAVVAKVREEGILYTLSPSIPIYISGKIEEYVKKAVAPLGVKDYNEMFWALHPGGRAILDKIEGMLGLTTDKLEASREILAEYGNTMSPCVLFVLDEMRRKSKEKGLSTAGEGSEYGLLVGFGPGLTVETVVLRAPSSS